MNSAKRVFSHVKERWFNIPISYLKKHSLCRFHYSLCVWILFFHERSTDNLSWRSANCVFLFSTSGHISPWKASKQVQWLNPTCFCLCVFKCENKKRQEESVRRWTRFVCWSREVEVVTGVWLLLYCEMRQPVLTCLLGLIMSDLTPQQLGEKLLRFILKLHLLLLVQSAGIHVIRQNIQP